MANEPAPLRSEDLPESLPCGVLVIDIKRKMLRANRTIGVWLRVDTSELVGKKKLQELLTMGGRIFHQTHWQPALQMQGSLAEVKFDVRSTDGTVIPMMLNAVRKKLYDVTVDIVTMTVAEERNKHERELVAARKRAVDLDDKERALQRDGGPGAVC